ncbi:hypothetical protein BGX38DRAFT_1227662 [Terfezia claveryi]|nr:hypothetical protein BGX38DRAFT_1227662 [Terfezia claveryi]
MSQPPDNSAKSKHHSMFHRLKHHLRKNKSGKGKGRAEDHPAPEPEEGDVFPLSHISAATNQQGPHHEHNCQCEVCRAIAEEDSDPSLMAYIQAAASGEAVPDVDCDCATMRARQYNTTISGHALPGTLVNNPDTRSPQPPTGHEEVYPQITIPNLHDTGPSHLPSITITRTNVPQAPVVADPYLNRQSINAPPIPDHLLRSLASRECRHGNGGAGHPH